jgi:hypothetical protein
VPRDAIIDAVTRPIADTHFQDAFTDAFRVPGIALFHAANAGDNARGGIGIPETVQLLFRCGPMMREPTARPNS